MQLGITKLERRYLFSKYIKEGATPEEADFRIRKTCLHLKNLIAKLKLKKISKEEMNRIFIEELEKISYC